MIRTCEQCVCTNCDLHAMAWSSDVSDLELIRLIHDDPQQGFTLLLQLYGGRIRGYLRQRFPTLDEGHLHDAVTDAMLKLADSFDAARGALPAWFLMLAHQQALGRLRADRAVSSVEDPEELLADNGGSDPLAALETQEQLQQVQLAIQALPALERAVVEADVTQGRTVAARTLAEQLGTTEGSIYAARKRARAKLVSRCSWVRDWLQSGNEEHG